MHSLKTRQKTSRGCLIKCIGKRVNFCDTINWAVLKLRFSMKLYWICVFYMSDKKVLFPVICGQCSSQDAYLMMCVCVLIRQVVINLGNNLIKLSKGLALAPMTSKRFGQPTMLVMVRYVRSWCKERILTLVL